MCAKAKKEAVERMLDQMEEEREDEMTRKEMQRFLNLQHEQGIDEC